MDTSIRTLLTAAQKHTGRDKNQALYQAYGQLRNVAESRPAVDVPDSFGPDLYVLCAEIAFQNGIPDMARECLKMYFMKPPPSNQFVCRAYLCHAQLLAPKDANKPEQLEKAVVYLVKAISFAKKNPRYHFLVYNASVIYWKFSRPFLKPNYRQYLARSLHQVVKALDDIEDKDYEWRAQLMIALIECHLDAGRKSDATSIASAAATFVKQNVPNLYKQVFGLIVKNSLLDSNKLHKDVKSSPELAVYYKILKLKVSYDSGEAREYYNEIERILIQMGVKVSETVSTSSEKTTGKTKARHQSPSPAPDGEREHMTSAASVFSSKSSRKETPSRGESTTPGLSSADKDGEGQVISLEDEKSPTKGGRRTPTPTSTKRLSADSVDKPFLLLELAHFCLELDFADLAQECVNHMRDCVVKDQGYYLRLEFLECSLMVKGLGDRQESYQKNLVDVRQQAIKRCEEAIMNSIRLGDPNVIQAGCVTQWNLCLPLLQQNLRQQVRKPLTLLAEALEDIQSLLIQLRCQIHTELAKCEEDQEQIQVAMDNLVKALALDDGNVYHERLEVSLRRLELRSQLYKQPDRPEDMAAMIIEQARKADSGTIRMKRSLLVKAGEALAPDAFLLVLDSESDTKDITGGKAPTTKIQKLANKARQFNKCVKKAEGHLKRLGDENDRERARLWGDLAKTARKQEVWDVCRVAARFCLLYDDNRWKNISPAKMESPKPEKKVATDAIPEGSSSQMLDSDKKTGGRTSRPSSPELGVPLYDKDLIRMLAEVSFVQGEATVHLLRSEGIQLNDMPIPPVDRRKHPKGYVAKKPEEDPDWIEYCDWIKFLSTYATDSFLRGLSLGVDLEEPWLVCSAAAYIWNYNNHILTQRRHREIMDTLSTVITGLKKVGHAGETVMLVNICGALSYALMQPWIPQEPEKDQELQKSPTPTAGSPSSKKNKGAPSAAAANAKGKTVAAPPVTISPDAMPDLKKAIEACEYAIEVTNGNTSVDIIPIGMRMPILQTWVSVKQMAQQQIPKTLGADDEPYSEGQRDMTRSIVAVEMLHLNKNGIMEFKEVPPITEVANMVENAKFTDKFIELQLWTRLTSLAHIGKLHELVLHCSKKALRFATVGTQPKNRKMEAHRYMVEQEMLSYSSSILGQSLMDNMAGKNAIRREALEAFLNSARYARNAENYDLVMSAARNYWNACVPLVSQPIERELLREPVKIILQCITMTAEVVKKAEEKQEGTEEGEGEGQQVGADVPAQEKQPSSTIGSPEDDLTLRASLYGVLFQSFADRKQWKEGLQAMDQAISVMPRTKHRLLIFKHRVMTKAKLGESVNMDIQKFKDESEDYVAHMWRRVALSSKETLEQLISYQAAIEALNSPSNEWLKVDYLIEFGQWLYCNEFPLQDAIDQIEWAVDIMLNMKTETELKKEATKKTDSKRNPTKAHKKAVQKEESKAPKKAAQKDEMKAAAAAAAGKKAEKKGGGGPGKGKGSAKPKGPPATPKPRSAESRTKTPDKSSDGRSDTSDGESELTAEGIVPVTKQAIIGVLPANSALTISDLEDVRQLDGLIRAHVLLAEISGKSSEYYKDYLLMSQAYLMRLLQVTIGTSGPTMKEIAKNPPPPVDSGKKDGSAKGKKKGEKEKEAPVKEKPKRKGPLDHIPSNTEDWAVYDCPDEVMDAFRHEMMKTSGINNNTITKPMLTMYYLDELIKCLRDTGYNHLALPILVLQDILSRDVLKNAPLNMYVHSKAAAVCIELNLKSGCSFHEKLAGPMVLNEEDQALSRDDIALWKEKQIQVAKEEVRGKESLLKAAEESKASEKAMSKMRSTVATNLDLQTEPPVESHLGKVLGAVTYRDVWTDIAELLIKQCHYQSAREFLNEAYSAALAFDDKALQSHILYLFGKLALAEAQFGQAFNFGKSAQENYEGDEMFWFNTTMLMVEATLNDYENRTNKRIARGILVHCLNEFARIAEERKNRSCITGYIVGMLEAKLASIQISIIFSEHDDINVPKVMRRILNACQKFETATEKLIRLGYKREVLPIMKEHSKVLRQMAGSALETEIRHTYYLQSMMVLKEACCLAEEVLHDVQTLTTLHETRNISLPTQRELADIMIECGEVMLEIFKEYSKEVRNKQLEDQRKGSVVKMVEDYIRATPQYTHMEKEWVDATKTVGEDALLKFVAAHNLSSTIPKIKARALSGIGRMLLAFSMFASPDPETQWIVHEMELIKLEYQTEENDNKRKENPESKNFIRYSKQIKQMNDLDDVSRHYMLQASECMIQALNLALQKHYTDVASTVSLELVNCLGQYDPQASSQFLALYQSCSTSQTLEILLSRAQLDPMTSRLAALLHQRSCIISNDISTNMSCGSLMTSVEHSLEQEWEAWKKLDVKTNHLELLKDFPSNFNFLILQHSPDRNYLYGAVLDRPKSAPAAGGKGKAPPVPSGPSRAKVFGVETSPELLDELLEKFAEHRQSVQQLLLKQEYQRAQAMMREKMLKNLDEDLIKKSKHFVIDDDAEEEAKLQEEFRELVNDMETYLKPITCQFEGLFTPQIITPASAGKDAKVPEPQAPQEYVILLADPLLLQMPLEALEFLQHESIVSLSRDFSLQVFHHRFYKEEPTPEAEKKKKEAKNADNPMSRIPGLRDASKKQAKIVPINRDIPHHCQGVDTMNFRYIVDPHLDCAETELNKPTEVFNKIVEEYENQFTPRWLGVLGEEHAPSVGEWEIYLVENSGFIFYGMERFLNYIPPAKLSALNIPECSMVYILDMAQTSKSFTRQSKVDVLKSANILALEKPVETMMLISLAGVKSVMANQWFCTLAENAQRLNDTMKDMLDSGKSNGEAIRMLFTPYRRKVESDEPEPSEQQSVADQKTDKSESHREKAQSETETSYTERSQDIDRSMMEPKDVDLPEAESAWFNMVCYGLPNLIITQL